MDRTPKQEHDSAVTPKRSKEYGLGQAGLSAVSSPQMIESPKMGNIHKFMTEQLDVDGGGDSDGSERSERSVVEPSARETAQEILEGSYDAIDYRAYANYLGGKNNSHVLRAFVELLRPFPGSLLLTLRLLVSRVYFIAEAQNIDRILEELSRQWVKCRQGTIWEDHFKICHIVLFSLLILNSDLHNEEVLASGRSRLSCEEFVENTLFALHKEAQSGGYSLADAEPLIVEELTSFYDSLKENSLLLLTRTASRQASPRKASRQLLRSDVKEQGAGHQLSKRGSRFSMRSTTLTSIDTSAASSSRTSIYSNSTSPITKESHFTSNWKFHHNKPLPRLFFQEIFDAHLGSLNGSLWFMDSVIQISERNISLDDDKEYEELSHVQTDKRRRDPKQFFRWLMRTKTNSTLKESPMAYLDDNARWIKARVRVFEGRIYIFNLKNTNSNQIRGNLTMDLLKKNSSKYFVFNLFEALADFVQENIVQSQLNEREESSPSSRDKSVQGNFTLTIPSRLGKDRTVLEFQTDSVEEARQYVACLNFWAARLTPVPAAQFELVSNEEYGWSENLLTSRMRADELDNLRLCSWKPLLSISALYEEIITEEEQPHFTARLYELQEFNRKLEERVDRHNRIKPTMVELWKDSKHFETAMDNWNRKYLYLNEVSERSSVYLEMMQAGEQSLQHAV